VRALAIALVVAASATARAEDEFEIQVYDADTAPPGEVGFELHVNTGAARQSHFTLEPHVGLTRWIEAGAYLQTALSSDGRFDYAGVKLRVKGRVPRRFAGVVGLALNLELSSVPAIFEANRWGLELRPIVDARWKRLYASVNPIVGIDLLGALAGRPQLEPAATVLLEIWRGIAIGAEYYAALGPVTALLPRREQVHRLFGVVDVQYGKFAVHAGAGAGLVAGERWIVKSILTWDVD
jgi:hypothetical protein